MKKSLFLILALLCSVVTWAADFTVSWTTEGLNEDYDGFAVQVNNAAIENNSSFEEGTTISVLAIALASEHPRAITLTVNGTSIDLSTLGETSGWYNFPLTQNTTIVATFAEPGQGGEGGGQQTHTHSGNGTWYKDGTSHWHQCTADGCTLTGLKKFDEANHSGNPCSVCGYVDIATLTHPINGKTYMVKNIGTKRYLNMDVLWNSGAGDISSSHKSEVVSMTTNPGNAIKFTSTSNEGCWKLQNVSNNTTLCCVAGKWTSYATSNPDNVSEWYISEVSTKVYNIQQGSSSGKYYGNPTVSTQWSSALNECYWGVKADQESTASNLTWSLIPAVKLYYKFVTEDGTVVENERMYNGSYDYFAQGDTYPTAAAPDGYQIVTNISGTISEYDACASENLFKEILVEAHTHTPSATWSSDDTYHWHYATCTGHTSVKLDQAAHTWGEDGKCTVCQKNHPADGSQQYPYEWAAGTGNKTANKQVWSSDEPVWYKINLNVGTYVFSCERAMAYSSRKSGLYTSDGQTLLGGVTDNENKFDAVVTASGDYMFKCEYLPYIDKPVVVSTPAAGEVKSTAIPLTVNGSTALPTVNSNKWYTFTTTEVGKLTITFSGGSLPTYVGAKLYNGNTQIASVDGIYTFCPIVIENAPISTYYLYKSDNENYGSTVNVSVTQPQPGEDAAHAIELNAGASKDVVQNYWYVFETTAEGTLKFEFNHYYNTLKVYNSSMTDVTSTFTHQQYTETYTKEITGTTKYYVEITNLYNTYKTLTTSVKLADVDVNVTAAGLATVYYSDRDLYLPEGVEAYTYKYSDANGVKRSQLYNKIPAGTGALVAAEQGNHTFDAYLATANPASDLVCFGTDESATTTGGTYYYALQNDAQSSGNYAWYWMNETGAAFTNGAHKAYIALTEAQYNVQFPQSQDARMIPLFGDETTGINAASFSTEKNGKFLENGRVVIVKNGKKFNAAGQLMK